MPHHSSLSIPARTELSQIPRGGPAPGSRTAEARLLFSRLNADDNYVLHGSLGETPNMKKQFNQLKMNCLLCGSSWCIDHNKGKGQDGEGELHVKNKWSRSKELVSSEDLSSHYWHMQQSCTAHQSHHQSNLRPPDAWKFTETSSSPSSWNIQLEILLTRLDFWSSKFIFN